MSTIGLMSRKLTFFLKAIARLITGYTVLRRNMVWFLCYSLRWLYLTVHHISCKRQSIGQINIYDGVYETDMHTKQKIFKLSNGSQVPEKDGLLLRRTFEIRSRCLEAARKIFETFNLYDYANLDQFSSTHSLRKLCLMRKPWPKKVQSFSLSHTRI